MTLRTPEQLGARVREKPMATWPLAGLLCTAGALLVVVLGTRLTFFNDDWYFLLQRPGIESHSGLDALLAPHNGNMVVLLAAVYKALVAIFGLGSQLPFRLVLGAAMACLGALVYVAVKPRLGVSTALAAAAVILFLGPAWEVLLFFGALNHLGALICGLGGLLLLELDTPRRNALACALLVCSVSLSGTGLAFLPGAGVAVLLRRRPGQLWVAAVPAALFGLWSAFYGNRQPSPVSAGHLAHIPRYVVDSVSSGLASITGLVHGTLPAVLSDGHAVTAVVGLLVVLWLLRGGRAAAWTLVFGVTAFAFWILTGASAVPGRGPNASRYQLVDATLLILFGAELFRGTRLRRGAQALLCAAATIVIASNLATLGAGFDFLRSESRYAKADLGALQIAGRMASPSLWLVAPVARDRYLSGVTAGRYFAVTGAHGTPPFYTPTQLPSVGPGQRAAADGVLAAADRIAAAPVTTGPVGRYCRPLSTGSTQAGPTLALPAGRTTIRNLGQTVLVIGISRFAPSNRPTYVGFLPGGAIDELRTPRDSVALRWRLSLKSTNPSATGTAWVCSA